MPQSSYNGSVLTGLIKRLTLHFFNAVKTNQTQHLSFRLIYIIAMKKLSVLLLTLCISLEGFSQSTYSDIAPILYRNCTSCHRPGGGAPFSMLTYNEISAWAPSMIHTLIYSEMPPWAADTSYMHFVNERPISQADKNALLAWIYDGALEGDPALLPPPPVYPKHQLNGVPDTVLQTTTFYSNAGANDAYNTIVTPLQLSQSRFIRAIELVPSDPSLIHHSLITADSLGRIAIDTSGNAFTISGAVPIGTWAPGSMPIVYPNSPELKMGIELPAYGEIAMQIHTPAGTLGQAVNVELRLYFYPKNETGIRPVYDFVPLQYWGNDFTIGAGQVKIFSTERWTGPQEISIFSAFPHSHQICTEILNYAYDPLGVDTIPLIKIDRWDFEHQEYYYFQNLVKIPVTYKYHADHTYDNTAQNHHNPNDPPQVISVGYNTDDEMLFDGFQYVIYQPGDENINVDSILKNDPLLNVIGIDETDIGYKTSSYVYPNPMKDKATIHFSSRDDNWSLYSLEAVNVRGQKVHLNSKMVDGAFEISKDELSAGMYFYQISRKDRKISAGRIIIQ